MTISPTAAAPRCAFDLTGRTVVVVEDEPLVAMDVAAELEGAGALVVVAHDLDEAVRIASDRGGDPDPDVAVLDVDLRGREVFPAAVLLRDRGIPIVFHTGRGALSALLGDYPRSAVVAKPSLPDQIVRTVAALVAA